MSKAKELLARIKAQRAQEAAFDAKVTATQEEIETAIKSTKKALKSIETQTKALDVHVIQPRWRD